MMYALKIKGKMIFACFAKTEMMLDEKIKQHFYGWYGMQERGSDPTMEKFMETRERVKLIIEPLSIEVNSYGT